MVKILALGICFVAFAAMSYRVMAIQHERSKEILLKAYGFELQGEWWRKPGQSIGVDTVEQMTVKRLVDYLEREGK